MVHPRWARCHAPCHCWRPCPCWWWSPHSAPSLRWTALWRAGVVRARWVSGRRVSHAVRRATPPEVQALAVAEPPSLCFCLCLPLSLSHPCSAAGAAAAAALRTGVCERRGSGAHDVSDALCLLQSLGVGAAARPCCAARRRESWSPLGLSARHTYARRWTAGPCARASGPACRACARAAGTAAWTLAGRRQTCSVR